MRLTNTGINTHKFDKLDDMFPAQDILLKTGQLVQFASGVFSLGNVPFLLKLNIERVIREEFEKSGLVEILLPSIQPKSIWDKSGRYDHYVEDGTMLTTKSGDSIFCLAPTAEEAVVEFAKKRLSSHKQLPVTFYQISEKFRNELRNRGYLFRGKAFTMMDAYSFDKDKDGLNKTYQIVKDAYFRIFKRLGLEVLSVAADSGSMGGSKSEEFMLVSEVGEDLILYNKEKGLALNTELLENENYIEVLKENYGIDGIDGFKKVKSIELGHIFQLGNHYSEKMDATFVDENEKQQTYEMGCYGIGVTRAVATIYEQNVLKENDEVTGFALPIEVSPYLGTFIYSDNKADIVEKLYSDLEENNVKTILDDRFDKKATFGSKLNNAKLYGAPYLFIMGNKVEDGMIQIENLKTGDVNTVELDKFKEIAKEASNSKVELEKLI